MACDLVESCDFIQLAQGSGSNLSPRADLQLSMAHRECVKLSDRMLIEGFDCYRQLHLFAASNHACILAI